jgi:transporter family-2 protein
VLILRPAPPSWEALRAAPWWSTVGGLMGCAIVYAGLAYAAKLGAGPFNGLLVTTSIITSLALDHYGVLGFQQHAINLWRLVGGALMVGGIALIATF